MDSKGPSAQALHHRFRQLRTSHSPSGSSSSTANRCSPFGTGAPQRKCKPDGAPRLEHTRLTVLRSPERTRARMTKQTEATAQCQRGTEIENGTSHLCLRFITPARTRIARPRRTSKRSNILTPARPRCPCQRPSCRYFDACRHHETCQYELRGTIGVVDTWLLLRGAGGMETEARRRTRTRTRRMTMACAGHCHCHTWVRRL
ncbi:hypothetical protein DENSPDRAFT_106797 [Dentipellis sp. KUC8613]|nr:hypothetical protein DENSPDRAFT_106797 [Dentipellis sp. KUC8613]